MIEQGAGLTLVEARSYLENAKVSGKTGRLVQDLLKLTEKPDLQNRHEAMLRALEHRIERAKTWARRARVS